MYVIVRIDTDEYLARLGEEKPYTTNLEDAWTFATKERAERERCSNNERVVSVESLLHPPALGTSSPLNLGRNKTDELNTLMNTLALCSLNRREPHTTARHFSQPPGTRAKNRARRKAERRRRKGKR